MSQRDEAVLSDELPIFSLVHNSKRRFLYRLRNNWIPQYHVVVGVFAFGVSGFALSDNVWLKLTVRPELD